MYVSIGQTARKFNKLMKKWFELDNPVIIGFFVNFGENFLFCFNQKNRNDQEPSNLNLTGIFIEMGVIEIEYELNKINVFTKIDEEPIIVPLIPGIYHRNMLLNFILPQIN